MSAYVGPERIVGDFGLPEPTDGPWRILREVEATADTSQKIIRGELPKLRFRLRMPDGRTI